MRRWRRWIQSCAQGSTPEKRRSTSSSRHWIALAIDRPQLEPAAGEPVAVVGTIRYVRGPIPPPELLQGYERVVPGGAERVLAMAERQAAYRQKIESRGQVLGFSLAAGAVAGSFLMIALGLPLVGVAGVIGAAAALSGLFIWGKAGGSKPLPSGRQRDLGRPSSTGNVD